MASIEHLPANRSVADERIMPSNYVPRLVSTVITSYNKGPYLVEAIQSALNQDYEPHEVIVVDDGSTDNTPDVCRSFGDRIRSVRQANLGQPQAKNRGLQETRGEFIAFLDGDDRWLGGKLTKQVALFRDRPDLGLVYSDRRVFSSQGVHSESDQGKDGRRFHKGRVLDEILVNNFAPFSSLVVRRTCLTEVGIFDETCPIAPDYDLLLRIARKFEFDYVDESLLEYRVGINSISGHMKHKFDHVMRIQTRFLERFFSDGYPNPRIVHRATAVKHVYRGDALLSQGKNLRAFLAYAIALRYQPMDTRHYYQALRALVPNRLASLLKSVFRQGDVKL